MDVRDAAAEYRIEPLLDLAADDVPAGYQRTEVGVIPEDWQLSSLGALASVTAGGTPDRANSRYWNGGIPWVTTAEIDLGVILKAHQFISKEGLSNSAAKLLPPGTLLMALYGQGKTRGKVGVLGIEAATNQACAAISLASEVNKRFVLHYLGSRYEDIRALSNTGNQENLNGSLVRSIPIPLPTKAEQESIAEALSDADALIESLQQLIAKQRAIKQGAMQALLTGRQRLPGFNGEWQTKRIGGVLTIQHGKSQRGVVVDDGPYPILATGGQIGTASKFLYDKPSVLIGRKGTIDEPRYMATPFWSVDTLFYSIVHEPNDALFLFYRFVLIDWQRYNEASGVPSLSARTIESIELLVPPPGEQTAIAAVLSDMDAAIDALEARLAKTRALKAGMMQQLLTGRIRLVPMEQAHA